MTAEAMAARPKIRLDMHTHTEFSPDSRTTLARSLPGRRRPGSVRCA